MIKCKEHNKPYGEEKHLHLSEVICTVVLMFNSKRFITQSVNMKCIIAKLWESVATCRVNDDTADTGTTVLAIETHHGK